MTDTIYRSGAKTIDGTTTSVTWEIPGALHGCLKVHAHDITGLTYTIQVSYDEGTTYLDVAGVTSEGVAVARGGTVTAIDNVDFLFASFGVTHVKVTRTAGSGPVQLVEDRFGAELQAARLTQFIASGVSIGSNKAEDSASASGDTGDFILGVRNDILATLTSADGDYGGQAIDKRGIVMVGPAPRELMGNQVTTITSSTSETTVVTAGASGIFRDIYGAIFTNTSATGIFVTLKDSTAGTTRKIIYVPPTDDRGAMIPGGFVWPQSTAANNWTITCSGSVASLIVNIDYVEKK